MADKGLHIVIAGGGMGGFAAALTILKYSPLHWVTILEAAEVITELGAGVTLYANGIRVLGLVGVDVTDPSLGCCKNPDGAVTFNLETGAVENASSSHASPEELAMLGGTAWLTVHRGDLLLALKAQVEAADRIKVRTGCRVASLDVENRKVTLHTGEVVSGDVIIGADGVRSVCRPAITQKIPPIVMTAFAYRYQIPRERVDPEEYSTFLGTYSLWPRGVYRIVSYPVRNHTEESWSLDVPASEVETSFRTVGVKMCDDAEKAMRLAYVAPHTKAWKIADREVLLDWSRGNCTLLGDSCHAMAMTLGQGLNQALEDAAVLGRCLAGAKFEDVEQRLRIYSDFRAERATTVQLISRAIITKGTEWQGDYITLKDGTKLPDGHHPAVFVWLWKVNVVDDLEKSGLLPPLSTK